VVIKVKGDDVDELNEGFAVKLGTTTLGTISDAAAKGTIVDNDGPEITVSNSVQSEPLPATPMHFLIHLSASSPQTVKVNYSTENGSASARRDYGRLVNQTVTFAPGDTDKAIAVNVRGDLVDEANEAFFVNLSGPVNGSIADDRGQGVILDNDCTGSDPGIWTATSIGQVRGDLGSDVLTKDSAVDCGKEVEWWEFEALEVPYVPGGVTAAVTLKVGDNPPQGEGTGNLNLCVYYNGDQVACSKHGGTLDEQVLLKAPDRLGHQEKYFLKVRVTGSGLQVNSYTLIVEGNVHVSGDPNLPGQ
jgi:Calx-beta domain